MGQDGRVMMCRLLGKVDRTAPWEAVSRLSLQIIPLITAFPIWLSQYYTLSQLTMTLVSSTLSTH